MKKHLLAFAVCALAAGGALAQANDTIAKVKATGLITMGVRDSSGESPSQMMAALFLRGPLK